VHHINAIYRCLSAVIGLIAATTTAHLNGAAQGQLGRATGNLQSLFGGYCDSDRSWETSGKLSWPDQSPA